ncbi:MAG: NAD(+)/NADH kinase [Proteobacteria bacterium]|nr:NAD(+)/NADH kinase [Pseudomonadota bacterium]MDA1300818.1 NAD(+)/NADH kinase [Pseudomonadota bacterium]
MPLAPTHIDAGGQLGIIVNPMSGRDVRRVAARAGTSAHMEKQNIVTRLVLGALDQGVSMIHLANEPFRISSRAVETLPERGRINMVDVPISHTDRDTEAVATAMWDAGCRIFIVLGGDGTSRIVSRTLRDATLLPVSTGTNNVFPYQIDATTAGLAAGLIATGKLNPADICVRAKQIHGTDAQGHQDIALIDAVMLAGDDIGSLLPFRAEQLRDVVLTRAEPASIGVSPIGGCLMPCHHEDDFAVSLRCGAPAMHTVRVPLSPGLHESVDIVDFSRIALGQKLTLTGPGVLAFDGDRIKSVAKGEPVSLQVRRDGPWVIDGLKTLNIAAAEGLMVTSA